MAGELSPEVVKALAGEVVLVVTRGEEAGTIYAHAEFLGAFQQAVLDRIEHSIAQGATHRSAMHALSHLRGPEAYKATLADALGRLRRHGKPLDPTTLRPGEHRVVAVFPT